MGDMAEAFRLWNEDKKNRKAIYQANELPRDLELLDQLKGVTYEIKNNGEHYILDVQTDRGLKKVDWYPSTGYWKSRIGKAKGARIHNLKKYYRLELKESNQYIGPKPDFKAQNQRGL